MEELKKEFEKEFCMEHDIKMGWKINLVASTVLQWIEDKLANQLESQVEPANGGLDEQFLRELNFIKCEKHYYRTKLYDDTYLEIDMNDWFASIVSIQNMETWKRERVTKMCLSKKMTKERLSKLLELIR